MKADLIHKTFRTVSAWPDESSVRAFATAEPHRSIAARLESRLGPTRFEIRQLPGGALPPSWAEAEAAVT